MSIAELIPEYIKTQEALEERLFFLQKQYKTPLGESAASVRRRIDVLTDELYEVRQVIGHLLSYQCGEEVVDERKETSAVSA